MVGWYKYAIVLNGLPVCDHFLFCQKLFISMSAEAGFISIDDDSFSLSKDERLVFFRIPKEVGSGFKFSSHFFC